MSREIGGGRLVLEGGRLEGTGGSEFGARVSLAPAAAALGGVDPPLVGRVGTRADPRSGGELRRFDAGALRAGLRGLVASSLPGDAGVGVAGAPLPAGAALGAVATSG
ncbi:MAG TPA: hypothetical protein VJU61_09820, partial [Polyangiaceae bacterium]|nr:hypothetical protein [Polyangiaceae bacterium]